MHPDGIAYFVEHFCHELPSRFEDLGCDNVDTGGLPVLHFLDSMLDFLRAGGRLLPLGAGYFVYCGGPVRKRGIEVSA